VKTVALGRLLLRLLIGCLFIGHGLQKLRGWFGGAGLEQTAGFFESLGLRPGRRHALAAGTTETAGGALLALGLATPLAVTALIAVMSTAIRKVHLQNGVWVSDGGFEYNAVLIAALALLAEAGPGRLSLDAALGIEKQGARWGLAALAGGALASATIIKTSQNAKTETAALDPDTGAEAHEAVPRGT
jgi:putative oxidoreductase